MVKKLLTFVIVLGMVSVASATVIDDFESYANTAIENFLRTMRMPFPIE